MRKIFLPFNYDQLMFQKFQNLCQGSRSVDEYASEFFMMLNRVDTHDSEPQLVARFIGGLRQQLQHTLNLFRPLSVSEAHQQAVTVEAQARTTYPGNSSRSARTNTTTASPSLVDQKLLKPETTMVVTDPPRPPQTGMFKCFSCGEVGHRQSACPTRNRRGLLLEEVEDET